MLAVALTAMVLLLIGGEAAAEDGPGGGATPAGEDPSVEIGQADATSTDQLKEAAGTVNELWTSAVDMAPKLAVALALVFTAWLLSLVLRLLVQRSSTSWPRAAAMGALLRIGLFLAAIAVGLSIIAGDARALLGSVGLIGLALSWALQTPIESFTGWLLNSFQGYYRVGDRIEVGEVFGDVTRIDVLTTTVWEAGGAGKAVAGAQPTGALITFPNWEVLRSNVINYSRDFPYVWDELTIGIANESDFTYTMEVVRGAATGLLREMMAEPAESYQTLLRQARLEFDINELPSVFLAPADAWTDCTIRYLVGVRQRRAWASRLLITIDEELARDIHRGRIVSAYPRQEIRLQRDW